MYDNNLRGRKIAFKRQLFIITENVHKCNEFRFKRFGKFIIFLLRTYVRESPVLSITIIIIVKVIKFLYYTRRECVYDKRTF